MPTNNEGASQVALVLKNLLANAGDIRDVHGQRSLVGCGPWGLKELDMTEAA